MEEIESKSSQSGDIYVPWSQHLSGQITQWYRLHFRRSYLQRYTLGDKLQQHIAVTDHSMWTGRATSCSNTVRQHVAATNCFVCTGEFLGKSLSLQWNFVAATSHKNQIRLKLCDLLRQQNSVTATKIFTKILQYTRSDLLLRKGRLTMLLQLVA